MSLLARSSCSVGNGSTSRARGRGRRLLAAPPGPSTRCDWSTRCAGSCRPADNKGHGFRDGVWPSDRFRITWAASRKTDGSLTPSRGEHSTMARAKYNVAATTSKQISVCLELTRAIGRARTIDEIYAAALDAVRRRARRVARVDPARRSRRRHAVQGLSWCVRGLSHRRVRLCRLDRRLPRPAADSRERRTRAGPPSNPCCRRWRTKASRR